MERSSAYTCPFCGYGGYKIESHESKNFKIIKGETIKSITASVRCKRCHARGPTANKKFASSSLEDKGRALKNAAIEALNLWNCRV